MAVDITSTATGALPYMTDSQTVEQSVQNQVQNTNQTGSNMNVYTDAQKAAQNQALGALSSVLSGQSVPSNFGLPQAAWDAAIANWNKTTAPILTAQHGAGTPALGSSMQELLLQLAGMSGQNAMSNFRGMAGDLWGAASTPMGNTTQQAQQITGQTMQSRNVNTHETGFDTGGALDALMSIVGNTIQALPF